MRAWSCFVLVCFDLVLTVVFQLHAVMDELKAHGHVSNREQTHIQTPFENTMHSQLEQWALDKGETEVWGYITSLKTSNTNYQLSSGCTLYAR